MDVQSYLIGLLSCCIFDSLNIADVIDRSSRVRNLLHSVIIKAMILNGLGFTGQRLFFPQLFHDDSYRKVPWASVSQ